jgi:Mycothiol-dependent nitroreductase Rv2466c
MTRVRVWVDPSCPWAWQTMRWLLDVRGAAGLNLTYSLFSLEVNATDPELPFEEAAPTYGRALAALALARRKDGDEGLESLYLAIGQRLHDPKEPMSESLLDEAVGAAGYPGLMDEVDRQLDDLAADVVESYRAARERDVFGVPTLAIEDDKVIYGPVIAVAPTGEDGLALWEQVRGLADRDVFFELKRWPRDVRPGGRPIGPSLSPDGPP